MRYLLAVLFLGVCVRAAEAPQTMVQFPNCPARIEVPQDCTSRIWMNGIELDCKDQEPRMYYCEKLKQASPK